MKNLLCTLVAGWLIGSALPTLAASTIDLTVKGLIVPSACAPSLSANGVVDVGRFSVKDLNQDTWTRLTPVTLQLNINCEAPTLFAMTATDNRTDSAVSNAEFGIGKTLAGERIGGYYMELNKAIADDNNVQPIASMDNGTTWFPQMEDYAWASNLLVSIQDPAGPLVPVAAQNTQLELEVNAYILGTRNLTITQDTPIDGSATIEVRYL